MWFDDSSPYRSKVMALRMKLEGQGVVGPLKKQERKVRQITWATCHPARIMLARGYCRHCYQKLREAGVFKRQPDLQATHAA